MNLAIIYVEKSYVDFMYRNNIRIYYDSTYSDYNWRIEVDHGGPFVYGFAERFRLTYTEFKRIMCYNSDCLFDLQLFGFKTQEDAQKSIKNLSLYIRGGGKIEFKR